MINLNDFLAVGQNAIARRVVQHSDASDNYSNAFKNLLATPRLIHWGIDASGDDGDCPCIYYRDYGS